MKERIKIQKPKPFIEEETKNIILIQDKFAEIIIDSKYGLKKALIDIEDIVRINSYNFFIMKKANGFYVYFYDRKTKRTIALHRLITNCPKHCEVDHINRNPLDNRKENLKVCSHFENMQNLSTNTSGKVGIYPTNSKWRARLHHNNKNLHLGYYDNFNDAVEARLNAELQYK